MVRKKGYNGLVKTLGDWRDFSLNSVQSVRGQMSKTKRKSILKRLIRDYQLYLLVLPVIIWYIIFAYVPMYGLQIAFKDYNGALGITASPWVGFKHFQSFFRSYYAWTLIKNTVILAFYSMIASFPFPIILSLLLNEIKNAHYKKCVQTVLYAPHFISLVVLVGMLNLFFSPNGLIDNVRSLLGAESVNFITSPGAFRHLYVWSGIWQGTGWGCIIYLAALSGVDPGLHEAAMIDGASRLQRMWHINLPAILPTATILFIMNAGSLLNVGFEKAFLMKNDLNADTAYVISLYIYDRGIIKTDFSFSAAVGLMNNVINFFMVLIVNRIAKALSETSLF